MPIYEYKCNNCEHEFEVIQKMSDAPVKECESCNQPTAVRLVSAPGFQLKGTGWYETDFKNKGKPKETSSASRATKDTNSNVGKDNTKSSTKDTDS